MSDREKLIKADQEKSIDIISHIDDFWLLHQIYLFITGMTKDTEYEIFAAEKGGVKA